MVRKILSFTIKFGSICLCLSIIALLCYLTYIDNSKGEANFSELIKNIIQVVTCFIASLSLILTVEARNESIKLKTNDKKVQINLEWYKTIVIERHLNNLIDFFNFSCALIDTLKKINSEHENDDITYKVYTKKIKSEVIQPFTEKYIQIQQALTLDASVISVDLSESLKDKFIKYQDDFIGYTQQPKSNYEQFKTGILETQRDIVKELKDYNTNNIIS